VGFAPLTARHPRLPAFSNPPNELSYISYILTWVPMDSSAPYRLAILAAIILPAVLGLVIVAHFFIAQVRLETMGFALYCSLSDLD
jgi:hypothetical protein